MSGTYWPSWPRHGPSIVDPLCGLHVHEVDGAYRLFESLLIGEPPESYVRELAQRRYSTYVLPLTPTDTKTAAAVDISSLPHRDNED